MGQLTNQRRCNIIEVSAGVYDGDSSLTKSDGVGMPVGGSVHGDLDSDVDVSNPDQLLPSAVDGLYGGFYFPYPDARRKG